MNSNLFGFIAAFLTTASFLPQAVLTIRSKDTHGLSLGMYSMFTSGVIFWLLYGIYKQDAAITVANALTLLLATPILVIKLQNTIRKLRKN
jgi:MtN3 and saliva related transmembrane protein